MSVDIESMTPEEAGLVFVTPEAYADEDRFHAACALLRRESPIHRVETEEWIPFWAITRHADVLEIELHNEQFHNAPVPVLNSFEGEARRIEQGDLLRTLIHMDEPDHKAYRAVTADWFLPKSIGRYEARIQELSKRFVDHMAGLGGECDFARDVAMQLPLNVILAILGLPESDYPRMLKLTQELFGASDPELSRGMNLESLVEVITDFFTYFTQLTEERRAEPTDDLVSVIANATINGDQMPFMETISYYVIAATAGHDTTASAIAGGMQQLIENPDELARLKADPSLVGTAVDEMIRWVTPVKHFMRNLTTDYTLASGHTFHEGEHVLLSYPSANRDESVFDDPFRFDVGRTPNKHLAFGFGAHYCLGVQLAKMELRAFYNELIPRIEHVELAGRPELQQTLFVGGLKRLPIRYEMR
jgi:cytochrome P450